MNFHVYRDCDQRFRLRKIVIELTDDEGVLINRTRMFSSLFLCMLKRRLARRIRRMKRSGVIFLAARES